MYPADTVHYISHYRFFLQCSAFISVNISTKWVRVCFEHHMMLTPLPIRMLQNMWILEREGRIHTTSITTIPIHHPSQKNLALGILMIVTLTEFGSTSSLQQLRGLFYPTSIVAFVFHSSSHHYQHFFFIISAFLLVAMTHWIMVFPIIQCTDPRYIITCGDDKLDLHTWWNIFFLFFIFFLFSSLL
jgi:hypothetical protein